MAANLSSLALALFLLLGLLSQLVSANQLSQSKLHSPVLQEAIVKEINDNPDAGWRAAMSPRLSNYTVGAFMHLLGAKKMPKEGLTSVSVVTYPKSLKLPASFDAREAWPQCATIGRILDQGHCGSCWAFAAVEALSDRFCIQFGKNTSLSVNDLLACCDDCGAGCAGGIPLAAWAYFVQHGIVTEECDPYFDQIGCSHPGCEPVYPTPKCVRHCAEGKLQVWEKSKRYSANVYSIESDDPHSIMAEVYKNGPVEVSFTVYEDFAHYKSGVYKHILGDDLGGHAVKLIGWGTSKDGEDYWLIANQWNKGWGDDGYFKIKRGTNECGIEDEAVAGLASSRNFISMGAFGDVASV